MTENKLTMLCLGSATELPPNFTGIFYNLYNGSKSWYLNGYLHREDGPAVEWANDSGKSWFLNGKLIYDDYELSFIEGNYIVVERGIPTDKMFGSLKLTKAKILTDVGTKLFPDNLPGLTFQE
jgi:hypothetical protein